MLAETAVGSTHLKNRHLKVFKKYRTTCMMEPEDVVSFNSIPSKLLVYLQFLLSLAFLYTFCHAVYNLCFHPLSQFPGPKVAAITRLYYIKYLLSGRLPFNNTKLHAKYGGIVRVAPNELSLNTAEGWRDIYGNRHGKSEMPKDPLFYGTTNSSSLSILGSSRERHGPLRRLVSHGFSEKALREQEPLIQSYCDLLMKQLYKHCQDEMVDMVKWYNFFTFDIIGTLTFGEPFGCLADGGYHPWVAAIFENVKAGSFFRSVGYYPLLSRVLQHFIPSAIKQGRKQHHAMTVAKVRARQAYESDRVDFMSGFLEPNADVSDAEMIATAKTIIVAGSETTATLLSGITYLLIQHPRVLKKLVSEVRSSFTCEDEINLVGANRLRYMLACLDEAIRMYPPVPSTFPRNVPPGGDMVGDKRIPGGTILGVSQFATYHSESNFYLPNEFIPERWTDDKRFVDDNKAAFQPFSTGPRNCVGRNLAYVEMRIVLARLLWNFDLVGLAPSCEDWADQNVYLFWDKPELLVRMKPIMKETPRWVQA